MSEMHLWPQVNVGQNTSTGKAKISVIIEVAGEKKILWYEISAEYKSYFSSNLDPFVVATLLYAMRKSKALVIHGAVSSSLLKNLCFLQEIWSTWKPKEYRFIDVRADHEYEPSRLGSERSAISSFSGGVDSCYTVARHRLHNLGRHREKLTSGLMVHGLDIPLDDTSAFETAAKKSSLILQSVGMRLITMATNWREVIEVPWEDAFGTAVASCLMMLQGHFQAGLIASGQSYNNPRYPWGSTPLSDRYCSSQNFEIIYDGADSDRFEKIRGLTHWPEALENLRVCWQGADNDTNCCECEKCIRTLLAFKVTGIERPRCFQKDVSIQQIRHLKLSKTALEEIELIQMHAKKRNIRDAWVSAMNWAIWRNNVFNHAKNWLPSDVKRKLREML